MIYLLTSKIAISRRVSFNNALILIYLVFVPVFIYKLLSQWAYDDPYITYRYARNLINGFGFVYNPGDRVLSTTTPLFTLLLALLGSLWSDLPALANLIGAFSLALGGFFLWDLALTWNSPIVVWSGLLLYPSFSLVASTIGSETPLYLAFCLASFAFYARQRYSLTALFAAGAVLARPDGILVAFILGIDFLLRQRKSIPWSSVALFIGISLAWFGFAWIYFGHPLPVTLAAKQSQGSLEISQRFAPGFLTIIKPYTQKWYFWLEVILAVLGVYFALRQKQRWVLFLLWPFIYFLSYSFLGVSRYFWYYTPLVPGFVVAIGLGIENARNKFLYLRQNQSYQRRRLLTASAAMLLAFLTLMQASELVRLSQFTDRRFQIYRSIGEWLSINTPMNAKVGLLEVGIIGYYAYRPVVDFAGLIQPEVAAKFEKETTYDDSALWAAKHFRPDYLVLHEGLYDHLKTAYVESQCKRVRYFSGDDYDYPLDLGVYHCQ